MAFLFVVQKTRGKPPVIMRAGERKSGSFLTGGSVDEDQDSKNLVVSRTCN